MQSTVGDAAAGVPEAHRGYWLTRLAADGQCKQGLQVLAPTSSGVHHSLPCAELTAPVVLHNLGSHDEDGAPPAGMMS